MTNEEAKKILFNQWQAFLDNYIDYGGVSEAYELAIKALEQEPIYTRNEVIAMLTELQQNIEKNVLADDPNTLLPFLQARETCVAVIQQKINEVENNDKGRN